MGVLTNQLLQLSNSSLKDFTKKLVPDTKYDILGISVPTLKKIAKDLSKNNILSNTFLEENHAYYEEYFIHGLLLGYKYKTFNELTFHLDKFLPYLDNWAICDSVAPTLKCFSNIQNTEYNYILSLLNSYLPYSIRLGVVLLKIFYLGKNFNKKIIFELLKINSNNYYVNMAIAWLLCEALIKNYNETIIFLENKSFSTFIHNKAIQKALESFRVDLDKKLYLRSLKCS